MINQKILVSQIECIQSHHLMSLVRRLDPAVLGYRGPARASISNHQRLILPLLHVADDAVTPGFSHDARLLAADNEQYADAEAALGRLITFRDLLIYIGVKRSSAL